MKKSKIPYILIALIVIFMALDISFVMLAKKSYTGVYTHNHYKKGLDFNKIYNSEIYGDKGWKVSVDIAGTQLKDNNKISITTDEIQKISVQVLDAEGRAIKGAKVLGKFLRPTTDKYDFIKTFEEDNGQYFTQTKIPFLGQWHLRIKVIYDEQEFVSTYKIMNM